MLWNHFVKMENHRLTKKVCCWDKTLNRFNWCSDIAKILRDIQQQEVFNLLPPVNISTKLRLYIH